MKYKFRINYGGSLTQNAYNINKNSFDISNLFNDKESSINTVDEVYEDNGLLVSSINTLYELDEVSELENIFSRLKNIKSDYLENYRSNAKIKKDTYKQIQTFEEYHLVNNNQLNNLIPKIENIYKKYFNLENENDYVNKYVLPKESKIIYLGDYHSSVHSLMVVIEHLKEKEILNNDYKLDDNYYIIFLGDIVDRGPFGIECLYIIYLLFYINNKDDLRIFILNGNHEEKITYDKNDFGTEMEIQLIENNNQYISTDQESETTKEKLEKLIRYLPLALFIKSDDSNNINSKWYQFCHGGIDKHMNTNEFEDFLKDNNYLFYLNNYDNNDKKDKGFLWADFANINFVKELSDSGKNAIDVTVHFDTSVNILLNKLNIMTIISGHQDETNYAFLLRENTDNSKYKLDNHYKNHGLYTFKDINENISLDINDEDNNDLANSNEDELFVESCKIDLNENNFLEKSCKINMNEILASVMSSATVPRNLQYSVYGILNLENNESKIVYLKPNFGI
jgi:hypothetical protein